MNILYSYSARTHNRKEVTAQYLFYYINGEKYFTNILPCSLTNDNARFILRGAVCLRGREKRQSERGLEPRSSSALTEKQYQALDDSPLGLWPLLRSLSALVMRYFPPSRYFAVNSHRLTRLKFVHKQQRNLADIIFQTL